MDERLAQVRALVDERWRVVQAKRQENLVRELRVGAFERILHGDLLVESAAVAVDTVALEKEITVGAAHEGKLRRELEGRLKQRARAETSVCAKQRQIDLLKEALKEQRVCIDAIWAEMLEDKAILRGQDSRHAEKERQARLEEERIAQGLQSQLMSLESVISANKLEAEKARSDVEILKHRKRSLEDELQSTTTVNHALKAKIARLRGPNYVEVVEQEVDAILRELDDMAER